MNASEFENYFKNLKSIRKQFSGVFSIDILPSKLEIRHFCITNTDLSTGRGIHWFAIIRYDKNTYEVFDSLGFDNDKVSRFKTYAKIDQEVVFNKTPFQKQSSDTCGYFCLYFLVQRLHNYDLDFEDLLESIFKTEDLSFNEDIVIKFSKSILSQFNDD